MPLRPARVVHVTTEQELDAALASADQVIVEGDDQLLSLAIAKASADPENEVSLEIEGERTVSTDSPSVNVMRAEPLQRARRPPAAPAPRSLVGFLFGVSVSLVLLTATITYVFLSVHSAHENGPPILASPSPSDARTPVSPEPLPELQQQQQKQQQDAPLRPPPPPSPTAIEVVQAVTWPAVSIVAIIAVFLIARQAIAGERNVEISWKVTEKVSGRVVITKVKTPAAKAARAANKAA